MSHNQSPIKKTFIGLAIVLIVGYGLFNSRFILKGPTISLAQVDKTTNTIVSPEKTLFLEGTAEHASFISINGRPIKIDESGKFNEKLLLSSGVSIIDIYAKDKFGKEVRKKVDVLYHGETPVVDYDQVALKATTQEAMKPTLVETSEVTSVPATPESEETVTPTTEPEVVTTVTTIIPQDTSLMGTTISTTPPPIQ